MAAAYGSSRPVYGPEYIIPVPFDPRLISRVSSAVAEAAIRTGVARREMKDADAYRNQLTARLDPSAALFQRVTASVRANPKRVVFAEGEEELVIRAAAAFQNSGLGKSLLVGREEIIKAGIAEGRFRRRRISRSMCRIRPGTRRPISRRSTSGCSGAARSIAIACAWSPTTATSMPPRCWRPAMPMPW